MSSSDGLKALQEAFKAAETGWFAAWRSDTPSTGERKMKVGIDPGHGGEDRGTSWGSGFESQYCLDLGLRLADLLAKQGYVVALTRTTDVDPSFKQRGKLTAGCDIVLCLH